MRKPHIDAKHNYPLNITEEHVRKAKAQNGFCNSKLCVLAEAIKGALEDVKSTCVNVDVTTSGIMLTFPDNYVHFNHPQITLEAIKTFDDLGEWYLPEGTYELLAPTPGAREKVRERAKKRYLAKDPHRSTKYAKSTKPSNFSKRTLAIREARKAEKLIAAASTKKNKCRTCSNIGHNSTTCPDNKAFVRTQPILKALGLQRGKVFAATAGG